MEQLLPEHPAVEIEERYRGVLQGQPRRATPPPAARSTARISPISPWSIAPKDIPAADASTGEQKALLIGLVLAHAGLLAEMTGFAPVLLLDEVVAHLDPGRRAALYDALDRLGAQVFMTGADPAAFAEVALASRGVHREPRPGPSAAPKFPHGEFLAGKVPGTSIVSGT